MLSVFAGGPPVTSRDPHGSANSFSGISESRIETTSDGVFSLQYVACLGCCSLAPVMMVDGEVHGRLTPEKAVDVLESYRTRD